MPELTEDEIQQLRALLPQANAEEAAEIIEEATEIIEEAPATGEGAEIVEEATEIIEEAAEVIQEEEISENESISENPESGSESAPADIADSADDAAGGVDVEPIIVPSGESDAISADSSYADDAPKSTHWWYRTFGRR